MPHSQKTSLRHHKKSILGDIITVTTETGDEYNGQVIDTATKQVSIRPNPNTTIQIKRVKNNNSPQLILKHNGKQQEVTHYQRSKPR